MDLFSFAMGSVRHLTEVHLVNKRLIYEASYLGAESYIWICLKFSERRIFRYNFKMCGLVLSRKVMMSVGYVKVLEIVFLVLMLYHAHVTVSC